jgi:hypothetical protein
VGKVTIVEKSSRVEETNQEKPEILERAKIKQKVFVKKSEESFISICAIKTNQSLENPPDDHERKIVIILRLMVD